MKPIRLFFLCFLFSLPPLFAAGAQEQSAAPAAGEEQLPISDAVLFTSGVGYFERTGTIEGNRDISFRFPLRDIDDLLKSLVVRDFDGGRIGEIRYGARDPLSRSLKSFSLDLTGKPDLAALIAQARGEQVSITGSMTLTGTILGVEKKVAADSIEIPVLMLLTDDGIRTVPFSEMESIMFTDQKIQQELHQALSLIAENRSSNTMPLSISFSGTGRRRVSAAYIVETPVWKTSYRLLLGEGKSHYLQGWAIVENSGEEDWNNVSLSLVAGRPVSFIMELSKPLYVTRPTVAMETEQAPGPQRYREAMPAPAPEAAYESAAPMMRSQGAMKLADRFEGVEPAATTESAGEFFLYRAKHPVSLPRQSSAMVPIMGTEVEGERVSIYDQDVHSQRPLNGLLLKNNTGMHLMGGPITLFEEDTYAGDALIDDIRPDGERLLSFSMDLDTLVTTEAADLPEDITRVRIYRGSLITTRLQRKSRSYRASTTAGKEKSLLIIHPRSSGWTLRQPEQPAETTAEAYRFRLTLPPGTSGKELTVLEERAVDQSVSLRNMGSDTVLFYLRQQRISNAVKEALRKVQELSSSAADAAGERERIEKAIRDIHQGQERIRANMEQLDRDSALYRRYIATLTSQEDQLEALNKSLAAARELENSRKRALEQYIGSLEVE
jgi:hypothetical protein